MFSHAPAVLSGTIWTGGPYGRAYLDSAGRIGRFRTGLNPLDREICEGSSPSPGTTAEQGKHAETRCVGVWRFTLRHREKITNLLCNGCLSRRSTIDWSKPAGAFRMLRHSVPLALLSMQVARR